MPVQTKAKPAAAPAKSPSVSSKAPVKSTAVKAVAVPKESTANLPEAPVAEQKLVNAAPVVQPKTAFPTAKIKTVLVKFTKAVKDIKGRVMPIGTATCTYGSGAILTVDVSGGTKVPGYGITDAVNNLAIFRVENSLYKNFEGAPMPYALFYNRGEALHVGRLDVASHGCVHVADKVKMKKLHDDIVKNRTGVTVKYGAGVLDKVLKQKL